MSLGWIIAIIVIVMAFIVGNVLLLRHTKTFNLPDDYQPKSSKSKDEEDDDW